MEKVQILLSTYNGEKYVEQQLDSLLQQTYRNINILIRDDGSTDRTIDILRERYNHDNISLVHGDNVGVIQSFFELLALSSDADYFAFCDQDDVWKPDKLMRAVKALKQFSSEVPTMYCSQVTLVDEGLNDIGHLPEPVRGASFNNALVENIAVGCTVVFNRSAKRLILQKLPNLQFVIMHDWWAYLVTSAFGKVIYDSESNILYRQHSMNSIGAKTDFLGKWITRVKRFVDRGGRLPISEQVKEFKRIFGEQLPPEYAAVLNRFVEQRSTIMGRLKYALSGEGFRQSLVDNAIFKMLIILNRI
ncbi:glycosyltransferase family 2 protein [Aneurinibacillus terranovensis]|uniref:glycosyltransferase family 2 protein n=1 Tax=Aneurinibacillus terranovensis TaxID=278991 RepID=UPI0003F98E92|nr:glycosyltransferase family 2 protein [Aneurinibacillus terranovensis]